MAAKAISKPSVEKGARASEAKAAEQWVLSELGKPKDFLRVAAKHLWGDYYRVNVYTSSDIGMNTHEVLVTDSFFVFKSAEGFLANPSIERKYQLVK